MSTQNLVLINVALNPKYPPKKVSVAGAMVRPVVAGMAIPPRGTRFFPSTSVSEKVLAEIERGMEGGALIVKRRFGSPQPFTLGELREFCGLAAPAPAEEFTPADFAVPTTSEESVDDDGDGDGHEMDSVAGVGDGGDAGDSVDAADDGEVDDDDDDDTQADEAPAADDASEDEAPAEDDAPAEQSTLDALLGDDPEEEPLEDAAAPAYTEADLKGMKNADLDELLVGSFDYPANKLYEVAKKAEKVAKVLELQGGAA